MLRKTTMALVLLLAVLISGAATAEPALVGARDVLQRECSRCHTPERALKRTRDRKGWLKTVKRMSRYARGKFKSPISDSDQEKIITYLTARYVLEKSCTACHGVDRVVKARHDRAGWEASVKLMESMGAVVVDGKRELLIQYLTEYAGKEDQ